jgi:hypothetical protein
VCVCWEGGLSLPAAVLDKWFDLVLTCAAYVLINSSWQCPTSLMVTVSPSAAWHSAKLHLVRCHLSSCPAQLCVRCWDSQGPYVLVVMMPHILLSRSLTHLCVAKLPLPLQLCVRCWRVRAPMCWRSWCHTLSLTHSLNSSLCALLPPCHPCAPPPPHTHTHSYA